MGAAAEQLPEGLCERPNTEALGGLLDHEADLRQAFADVAEEDTPDILARHVADADAVRRTLAAAKPADRVALANMLLHELNTGDRIAPGPTQLQSLHRPDTASSGD